MLELKGICVSFDGKEVLRDCDLTLPEGGRVALMGPSGCGKSTLLRVALGLQRPDVGTVTGRPDRTAAVFQEPRLLPWRTAEENVNLVLADNAATLAAARGWLGRVELEEAAGLYPAELSGGMQQRVSLARALAFQPELLVLDEPFKAMDEGLRQRMLCLMEEQLAGVSLLLATHSEEEARRLGCRILRYRDDAFFGIED